MVLNRRHEYLNSLGIYTDQGFINGVDSKAENTSLRAQGAIDAFAGKGFVRVFQDESKHGRRFLGSLTAYDPNVNFNGGILTVNQQPADIT